MHYLLVLLMAVSFVVTASGNPADSYLYRDYCPEGESVTYEKQTVTFPGGAVDGGWFNYLMTDAKKSWKDKSYFVDKWNLAQCNCTSYVASKLNTDWGNTNPQFSRSYYGRTWGNASTWFNAAYASQIGITGARDRFTFTGIDSTAPSGAILPSGKPGVKSGMEVARSSARLTHTATWPMLRQMANLTEHPAEYAASKFPITTGQRLTTGANGFARVPIKTM